jgi:hypothetical protein
LRSLGDGSDTEIKFGEYKFYTSPESSDEYLVDIHNWLDILMKEESEKLDLWIKRVVPDLTITEDTKDGELNTKGSTNYPEIQSSEANKPHARSERSTTTSNSTVPSAVQPTRTTTRNNPERAIGRANASHNLSDATFQPFFEWPFLNDEGKLDKRSPEERAMLWLHRIHGALQSKYGTMIEELNARDGGLVQVLPSEDIVNDRQRKIRPCSYADMYARLKEPKTKNSQYIDTMKSLCAEAELLFRRFIRHKSKPASTRSSEPQSYTPQSHLEDNRMKHVTGHGAIELYWGAVDSIILVILPMVAH